MYHLAPFVIPFGKSSSSQRPLPWCMLVCLEAYSLEMATKVLSSGVTD